MNIVGTHSHEDAQPPTPHHSEHRHGAKPGKSRRTKVGLTLIAVAVVGFILIAFAIPMPYVIEQPGPTFDVLATHDNKKMVTIKGADTYNTSGQLRMVTVGVNGGPGKHVTGAEVVEALINPDKTVTPQSQMFPKNMTEEQVKKLSAAQMASSQNNAEVAALDYLGVTTPATMTVSYVPDDSPSHGIMKEGDVLTFLQARGEAQQPLVNAPDTFRYMGHVPANTPVTVGLKRDGKPMTVTVTTRANPQRKGGSLLGIYLEPDITMPYDITIALEDVGGPSAGVIFALGIIDTLTKQDMVGDNVVAGTGAISMDGVVEPISGVDQKMIGASRDGAQYFLLPAGNCADITHIPQGLTIIPVTTLSQAVDVVTGIGAKKTHDFPVCPAV